MVKPAKDVRLGDTIRVNLGMQMQDRIVDRVIQDGVSVTIVLYSPNGKRPRITLTENHPVDVVVP